jgi:hypothetical protein
MKPISPFASRAFLYFRVALVDTTLTGPSGSDLSGGGDPLSWMMHGQTRHVNIVTIVAWAAVVGKVHAVNHWLQRVLLKITRSANLVFGWAFDRQATAEDTRYTETAEMLAYRK